MFLRKEIHDFLIVSQFLNFSKAADYLGVQQSGLSKSIKKLEEELGKGLFIRKARGLKLTEVGEEFKVGILNSQEAWEKALEKINKVSHELSGKFSIGFHPIIANFILPKLKNELAEFSQIELRYDFSTSRECTEKVLQNELDLAIVANPIEYPDLVIKKLWKEYIGLYSANGKIKDEILFNNKMLNAQKLLSQYPSQKKQQVDDYEILYSLIKRTNSMGLLPHPIAEKEGKLKLIKKFNPSIDVCLVYRSDRFKSKAFLQLIKALRKIEIN